MPNAPRFIPLLCLGLGLLTGCPRTVFNDVPTLGETTCKVKVGDQRSLVLLRCGPPCGGGQVEGNLTCDVYGHAELCYREGRVETLRKLAPRRERFAQCRWEQAPSGQ
jgi:hypothetical protein